MVGNNIKYGVIFFFFFFILYVLGYMCDNVFKCP